MIVAVMVLVNTDVMDANNNEISMVEPRTKFGAVVVAVARMFVPNNSEAVLINTAQ